MNNHQQKFSAVVAATLIIALAAPQASFARGHQRASNDPIDLAIAADIRTAAEKARDRNRQPKRTLEFFGLEPDMRVVEILPGGGWYTKILVPVLRDEGEYIAVGGLAKAMGFGGILTQVSQLEGFQDLNIVDISSYMVATERRGYMDMKPVDFGVKDADLVLTFRNLHNLTPAARSELYIAALAALKKGGRFGVVDHTRRHMAPMTDESWRRLDPVQVVKEITGAGFKFVDYSTLHHRPDDELRFEVGRKTVRGNSDRFTLLFEK
ncbi:MAG: class I SAM-dependent methyltransferase [Chromatiales bacterium]|nr:MAG: class I SAM-dependent methyltransferase [Chromatiales bacterium]